MQTGGVQMQGRFVMPEKVVSHFHLRPGDAVADFGAGAGYFVEVLAQAVGHEGQVYACEIQKELVEKIGAFARSKGFDQVHPVWSDVEDVEGSTIAAGALDAVILVNTLFQAEDKAALIAEANRVLRSGGKFFVIDWTESFGGLGPHPDEVTTTDAARALGEQGGFVFDRSFDAGDHHYGLALRKS